MADDGLPDLTGKVLAIYFKDRADIHDGAIIEEVRFEKQAGRLFLVGRVPRGVNPADWNAGLETCIAWDAIGEYTVFESVEDFQRRVGRIPSPGSVH